MKKPTTLQIAADPRLLVKYEAFLAEKAEKNKAYRARRTEREQKAQQEAKAARANRDIDPTREEWLTRAATMILKHVAELGYVPTGPVKTSLSVLPKTRKEVTNGRCYHAVASAGGFREIFISVELTEIRQILGVLTHEIGHAVLKDGVGHRNPFRVFCEKVGFEFKEAKYAVDGAEWWIWARRIADELGPIPHKRLNTSHAEGEGKKQKARMLKLECPCCGIKLRIARAPLANILETSGFALARCIDPSCTGELDFSDMIEALDKGEGDEEE